MHNDNNKSPINAKKTEYRDDSVLTSNIWQHQPQVRKKDLTYGKSSFMKILGFAVIVER